MIKGVPWVKNKNKKQLSVRGFPGFPESLRTKLWQKFRIQEHFKNNKEKAAFFDYISNTKKVSEQLEECKDFGNQWPP